MTIVGEVIGVCCAIGVCIAFIVNGSVMLWSPKAWFELPSWIRATGTLRRTKYSTGWGALQVRILGAIFLGAITWMIYEALLRR
jgi:hypothetical protein